MKHAVYSLIVIAGLFALPALAEDDLDVTMSVVEDEKSAEEQLVNEIELPAEADERARDRSGFGTETADEARQQGQESGRESAEQGRDNREDSGNVDGLPEEPPATP